mmetsp:Transcript_118744/g.335924  ORF Transcript_118744/g.335924 Transcript_118744/m.335924 type:complete len:242 (+) Transcript_118744:1404-2129(+)
MDPKAPPVRRLPRAALRALEAINQQRRPWLVHAEALPCVVRVAIRALLHRQQLSGQCRRGTTAMGESTDGHVTEFVLDSTMVDGGIPALAPLTRFLWCPIAVIVLALVLASGVERGPQLIVEFSRVARQLGRSTQTLLLLVHAKEALLVPDVFCPSLEVLAVFFLPLLLDLSACVDDGAPENVDFRMDAAPLLTCPPLFVFGVSHRVLTLLFIQPWVDGLREPIGGVVEDLGSLLRVPVIA